MPNIQIPKSVLQKKLTVIWLTASFLKSTNFWTICWEIKTFELLYQKFFSSNIADSSILSLYYTIDSKKRFRHFVSLNTGSKKKHKMQVFFEINPWSLEKEQLTLTGVNYYLKLTSKQTGSKPPLTMVWNQKKRRRKALSTCGANQLSKKTEIYTSIERHAQHLPSSKEKHWVPPPPPPPPHTHHKNM